MRKRPRSSSKENLFVICTIALCFIVTLALCIAFSGKGFLSVFFSGNKDTSSVYAICTGGYSDISLARSTADLIRQRGGAGYLNKEENYEIYYAVYPDEDAAKGVLSTLGENGAYVKRINIPASSLKWAGSDKADVEEALRYYDITFETLYSEANLLNSNERDIEDTRIKISILKAQIENIKGEFYQKISGESSDKITEVKLAIITALALLDNVNLGGGKSAVASSLRYANVQLVFCRLALMEKIA